ncbi:MAG TPA: SRPBCC domain-containing protein [Arachnia sp.]|nr:SRPBCC domain-containing protein [Arachnia sp.]
MDTMEETTEPRSVRVTRVVAHPLDSVWNVLMKPHGAEALLGEGGQLGSKGEDWRAADGTYGVTRSFHPREQIRFSWHASDGAPRTLVDLHMRPAGDRTELELVHEHLPQDVDADELERRWQSALERIDSAAS